MRLEYLEINNVLSYGVEERIEFDDRITTIVGPNGAGKSNILRILTLVRDVIRRETLSTNTPGYQTLSAKIEGMCPPHQGVPRHSEIRLGVTLTTDDYPMQQSVDASLLKLFLRGVEASARAELPRNNDFVAGETSNPQSLGEMYSALRSGVLLLRHQRTLDAIWTLAYEFEHGGKTYRWAVSNLSSRQYRGHVFLAGSVSSEQPEEYKDRITVTQGDNSYELVSYGSMFPSDARPLSLNIKSRLAGFDSGSAWDQLVRADLVIGYNRMADSSSGLERVLAKVVADRIVTDLDDVELGAPATTSMEILADPSAPAKDVGDPAIPRYLSTLHRWSVGDGADRERYARACTIFTELLGDGSRPELKVSATRNVHVDEFDYTVNNLSPDRGQPVREYHKVQDYAVTIEPMIRRADNTELPLSAIGSGGVELLRLATFLAADPAAVVLLDEPAAHLHPRAQEKLLQFLRQGGAQYVIVSHSPGLLPTWKEGVGATIRVSLDENGFSRSRIVGKNEFDQTDQLQRLVITQPEVRAIPFADKVILVSGQTELIAYPAWFSKLMDSEVPGREPHFVNFQGDAQFSRYLRVVDAFHVPWTAIVDGKSFEPVAYRSKDRTAEVASEPKRIPRIANQILEVVGDAAQYQRLSKAIEPIDVSVVDSPAEWFESWRDVLERFGVFTLANCWHDKKKIDEKCEQCGEIVGRRTDLCKKPNCHPEADHIESFEDTVRVYVDHKFGSGRNKPLQIFELLIKHPSPPDKFREILAKANGFGGPGVDG
jgi:hypothetical protein